MATPRAPSEGRTDDALKLAAVWKDEAKAIELLAGKVAGITYPPRNGASTSLILVSRPAWPHDRSWIAKLSFQSVDENDDRPIVEQFVNAQLARFAPNFPFVMHHIANHTFPLVLTKLGISLRAAYVDLPPEDKEDIRPAPTGYLMMSELGTGCTLG